MCDGVFSAFLKRGESSPISLKQTRHTASELLYRDNTFRRVLTIIRLRKSPAVLKRQNDTITVS